MNETKCNCGISYQTQCKSVFNYGFLKKDIGIMNVTYCSQCKIIIKLEQK